MRKFLASLFTSVFLLAAASAGAQEDEGIGAVTTDTTYTTPTDLPPTVDEDYDADEDDDDVVDPVLAEDAVPVAVRSADAATRQRIRSEEEYWYADSSPYRKPPPPPPKARKTRQWRSWNMDWVSPVLWVLGIGALLAIIYLVLRESGWQVFQKRSRTIVGEGDPSENANIFEIKYDAEIAKAIADGNTRLATRLMYLQILTLLSQGGHIQYKQERTNRDYLQQLWGGDLYRPFFSLTRHYDYVWYGKFVPDEASFAVIRTGYENLKTRLLT